MSFASTTADAKSKRSFLTKHLEESDRKRLEKHLAEQASGGLTAELHIFQAGSPIDPEPMALATGEDYAAVGPRALEAIARDRC